MNNVHGIKLPAATFVFECSFCPNTIRNTPVSCTVALGDMLLHV